MSLKEPRLLMTLRDHHQSWAPYPQIFLPEREINFQFTEATLFGFSITHSQIHF